MQDLELKKVNKAYNHSSYEIHTQDPTQPPVWSIVMMISSAGFSRSSSSSSPLLSGHLVASYDIGRRHLAIGPVAGHLRKPQFEMRKWFYFCGHYLVEQFQNRIFIFELLFFFLCSGSVSKVIKKLPLNSGGAFFCVRSTIAREKLFNRRSCLIGHARLILDNGTAACELINIT